ncbi:ATP-binding cassette domain-containing protein [Chitinophaga sp. G-6-1-13]|uniref:ATP-binding cassette domain-containing protein n=2 Tax=Chitinophaga fulva TaxID=2728842 RepID=A0A848GL46_9BACT|nr:ATP-binding cassette domain-containing protein [Chitinophaga fulva]NML39134.1 ATP-binding cassette domain-containing protein [Chitinophaga fulva]
MSSLNNIGVLIFVNRAVNSMSGQAGPDLRSGLFYFGLIICSYIVSAYFQRYMVDLTNEITYGVEMSVIEKVRAAPYEAFEKLGYEKIYSAISDARVLSRMPTVFINLVNAFVTLVCTLIYLLYTSLQSGVALFCMMVLLLAIYVYRDRKIAKDLEKVRDLQDVYYSYLRELLHGFRQIRISAKRSDTLFTRFIYNNRGKSKSLNVKASRSYAVNELSGVYSWYVLLGIIIFVLPALLKLNAMQVTGFITAVLFMISPLSQIIIFLPSYTMFRIALDRINKIDSLLHVDNATRPFNPPVRQFESIRFENIVYAYDPTVTRSFQLDIKELVIRKEELLFIIGGNGSGKTTFINLLTGLYKPQQGKVFIDDHEVAWEDYCHFVNNMAVVFTNQYLFKENYDEHDLSSANALLEELTTRFNLQGLLKPDFVKGTLNTDLSRGQQKRLALLLAMLEDTPLIVLDEWAAEQDTVNKQLFYTEWLEMIRKMGKAVVVVSHDEEYYQCADRVMKFRSGNIINEWQNNKVAT